MTTCKPPRKKLQLHRTEVLPPKPDRRIWEADKTRAFEAGVRWFLAVSRSA